MTDSWNDCVAEADGRISCCRDAFNKVQKETAPYQSSTMAELESRIKATRPWSKGHVISLMKKASGFKAKASPRRGLISGWETVARLARFASVLRRSASFHRHHAKKFSVRHESRATAFPAALNVFVAIDVFQCDAKMHRGSTRRRMQIPRHSAAHLSVYHPKHSKH